MSSQTPLITIPSVTLTLDQLLAAVRQLDDPARTQVAKVLLEKELDARLAALIRRLSERKPPPELSETDINAEVRAVRLARAQGGHAESRR